MRLRNRALIGRRATGQHLAYALAVFVSGLGCGASPEVEFEPAVPQIEGARPWLMYATLGPEGGRFGGLQGALQDGVTATVTTASGERIAQIQGDARGRFSVPHSVPVGAQVVLRVGEASLAFVVREAEQARQAAVHAPAGGVGAVPNDLIGVGRPGDSHAVVVRSGDNAVSQVGWVHGLKDQPEGVRIPALEAPEPPTPASPWLVTALDADGRRVAVSASMQARIYILDLQAGQVERTLSLPGPVQLPAPFQLARPFDVDGDGHNESEVQQFMPRTPQPVALVQGRLLVGYASVLQADLGGSVGQVVLPAVIASYDVNDLSRAPTVKVLPRLNPQEIRPGGEGAALVTCSGTFRILGVQAETPGAVYRLDPTSLELLQAREFETFLPTTALEQEGRVWVGSLGRPWIENFAWQDNLPSERLGLNDATVDSVFRLFELPGGLIGVPSFNTDRLHILDPYTRSLDPEPFYGPLQVGPGGQIFDGLQIVARRPGRAGVDFVGPDLLVLSGIAARLTPVELRKILGP